MAHHFRSRPQLDSDIYRQTRSAANVEEVEQCKDEALINPNMPQYITKAPWYLNKEKPTLSHQRANDNHQRVPLDQWYNRGIKKAKKITKFRKGACTNCGSMTHNAKMCMDRPRKVTAKLANLTYGDDEEVQNMDNLTYEAKHDRWNGYNPEMYKEVIQNFNKEEEERRRIKEQQLEQKLKNKDSEPKNEMDDVMSDSDLDDGSDAGIADKDVDDNDPDLMKNPRIKTVNQNLRSRTETVKYLQNLWDNTAHYDGKSRAMRENPNTKEEDTKQKLYQGDNKRIYSGQFLDLMDQDNFTKEAKEKGDVELNNVAMPSQAELAFKSFKIKTQQLNTEKQKALFEKYGGEEHANIPDEIKMNALKEQYEAIENAKKAKNAVKVNLTVKSKYEEDVLRNGHTKVWGSFWHQHFGWGYKCCYSFEKDSKCRGEHGLKEFYAKEYELKYNKKADRDIEAKKEQERLELQRQAREQKMKELTGVLGEIMKSQAEKDEEASDSESSKSDDSSSSDASNSSSSSSESEDSNRRKRKRSSSPSSSPSSSSAKSFPKRKRDKKRDRKSKSKKHNSDTKELDQEKLKEAIQKEKERKQRRRHDPDRDRKYNSLKANDTSVTAEELEAYRMQRELFEDPMRNYKDEEDN